MAKVTRRKLLEASSKISVGAERIERLVKHLDEEPAALLIAAAMRYPQEIWGDLPAIEKAMINGKDLIYDLLLWYHDRALYELSGHPKALAKKEILQIFSPVTTTEH